MSTGSDALGRRGLVDGVAFVDRSRTYDHIADAAEAARRTPDD